MRFKEGQNNEAGIYEANMALVDSTIELIERDAKPGVNQLRYLDREQGVIVSVVFGDPTRTTLSKLLSPVRLKRAQTRNNYFRRGVSVQILDIATAEDVLTDETEPGIGGVLINWGGDQRSGSTGEITAYPVVRAAEEFPNLSHEAPSHNAPVLSEDRIKKSAQILTGLKRRDLIKDEASSRTTEEVIEDDIFATGFVQWVENIYKESDTVFDIEQEEGEKKKHTSLEWFDYKGQMNIITFIPFHFEDQCVVVLQEQTGNKWQVREYMVLRGEKPRRIYKSSLSRPAVPTITDQGPVTRPPYSLDTTLAPLNSREGSVESDNTLSEVLRGANRVTREEVEDLIHMTQELNQVFDEGLLG